MPPKTPAADSNAAALNKQPASLNPVAKAAVPAREPVATRENEPVVRQLNADDIRAVAYFKWEAAGCPQGDGAEFWILAEQELRQQASPTQSLKPALASAAATVAQPAQSQAQNQSQAQKKNPPAPAKR